jgi:hypothetical protein
VPAEKLLLMNVKEGWGPLCKFLGKPVPDGPFPHANEADAVAKIMPRAMIKVLGVWIALASVLGAAGWALWTSGWESWLK